MLPCFCLQMQLSKVFLKKKIPSGSSARQEGVDLQHKSLSKIRYPGRHQADDLHGIARVLILFSISDARSVTVSSLSRYRHTPRSPQNMPHVFRDF